MARSMTGFGRGECTLDNTTFTVEIKAVNHRYGDLNIKMPRVFSALEEKVREMANEKISRGKVDIYINYDSFNQDASVKLDLNLAEAYAEAMRTLKEKLGLNDSMSLQLITKFPDIIKLETKEKDLESLWEILKKALAEALDGFVEMREREGARLLEDLRLKLDNIVAAVEKIKVKAPQMVVDYEQKMRERLKEILKDTAIDENRILNEAAIFADRTCVDEELVRLESHIKEFNKTLKVKGTVGKKLDFILQEMNREINTTGSKATDIEITNLVIELKTELEKIREQVQNLE